MTDSSQPWKREEIVAMTFVRNRLRYEGRGGWLTGVNDKRRGVVVVVAMLAASCGGGFVPPSPETPPDAAMEAFVTSGGLPGLAVAVIKDRELFYSKVAGVRKRGDLTTVAGDDAFHIGSNTKAFTALIAATVVDAGQITWDTKWVTSSPTSSPCAPSIAR
jgi:hypothetical protein